MSEGLIYFTSLIILLHPRQRCRPQPARGKWIDYRVRDAGEIRSQQEQHLAGKAAEPFPFSRS